MNSADIKKDVEDVIRQFMNKEKLKDYEVHFEGEFEGVENTLGEILFVRVATKDEEKTFNMAVKTAKRSEELIENVPLGKLYEREILVYNEVFPKFKELIDTAKCYVTCNFYPKMYFFSEDLQKETILFENLRSRGYKMLDRRRVWKLDHSLKAMEAYGEFHALSIALKDKKPDFFDKLANRMPDLSREIGEKMKAKEATEIMFKDIMESLKKRNREDIVKKFNDIYKDFVDLYEPKEENDIKVFSHGDCWNNNYMFQYLDGEEAGPTSICFLDFQYSTPRLPVEDISYHIYTTLDGPALKHFDKILRTYHESLTRISEKMGTDMAKVPTFETLLKQWKKHAKFGIISAMFLMQLIVAGDDETIDFVEISKKSDEGAAAAMASNIQVKDKEEYDRRMTDVFIHFGENFL